MTEKNPKGEIVFYGAGGCGINNVSFLNNAPVEEDFDHFAEIKTVYVDASHSNLRNDFNPENVFVLPNVDGSGKVRKENHKEITRVIKQILLDHPPGDMNVVVFSASGGSGSVIGPLILGELLERGMSAVCIIVGTDESVITANNTLNTIKSLEAISKRTEHPVVMYYEHNDRIRTRKDVNVQISLAMSTLAVLANRMNREIDTKDIANWLQFNKTTSVDPQVALLEIFTKGEEAAEIKNPISIASIYSDEDVSPLDSIPEYHAAGYLNKASDQFKEIHYVISLSGLSTIYDKISKTLEDYTQKTRGRIKQDSILKDTDQTTEEGLVL